MDITTLQQAHRPDGGHWVKKFKFKFVHQAHRVDSEWQHYGRPIGWTLSDNIRVGPKGGDWGATLWQLWQSRATIIRLKFWHFCDLLDIDNLEVITLQAASCTLGSVVKASAFRSGGRGFKYHKIHFFNSHHFFLPMLFSGFPAVVLVAASFFQAFMCFIQPGSCAGSCRHPGLSLFSGGLWIWTWPYCRTWLALFHVYLLSSSRQKTSPHG